MMFTTAEVDGTELRMVLAAFQGLGALRGGNTLQVGKLAEIVWPDTTTLPSRSKSIAETWSVLSPPSRVE